MGNLADDETAEDAEQTNYASSSTIFFYVDLKDNGSINDVDVYTGYANAPSVEDVAAEAAFNAAGRMAAVSFEGGAAAIQDITDYLYVTDIVSESSDYTTVEAILAGTDEVVEINVTDDIDDGDVDQLYLFSVDDDGNYNLDANIDDEAYLDDVDVDYISGTTVSLVDGGEYEVTDETMWVEQEDGKYDTVSLGSLPANRDRATVHTLLVNSDDEILVIVTNVTTTEEPEEPIVTEGIEVDLSDRAHVAVTWTGEEEPTEDELYAAVVAAIEDAGYTVDSVVNEEGQIYVITATRGTLTRTYTVDLADATQADAE